MCVCVSVSFVLIRYFSYLLHKLYKKWSKFVETTALAFHLIYHFHGRTSLFRRKLMCCYFYLRFLSNFDMLCYPWKWISMWNIETIRWIKYGSCHSIFSECLGASVFFEVLLRHTHFAWMLQFFFIIFVFCTPLGI